MVEGIDCVWIAFLATDFLLQCMPSLEIMDIISHTSFNLSFLSPFATDVLYALYQVYQGTIRRVEPAAASLHARAGFILKSPKKKFGKPFSLSLIRPLQSPLNIRCNNSIFSSNEWGKGCRSILCFLTPHATHSPLNSTISAGLGDQNQPQCARGRARRRRASTPR